MNLRDTRLPPFCWQATGAIEVLHADAPPRAQAPALALYLGLTYLAAKRYRQGGHEGFTATRAEVAKASGLSAASVHKFTALLEGLGLLVKQERSVEGRTLSPIWELLDGVSRDDTRVTQSARTATPSRAGETSRNVDVEVSPSKAPTGEPDGFADWLEHHCTVTGSRAMAREGTSARKKVAKMYATARREYPDEDLTLISLAAQANRHRRENGYTGPESVLRPMSIPKLLDEAKRVRHGSGASGSFRIDEDRVREREREATAPRPDDPTAEEVGF